MPRSGRSPGCGRDYMGSRSLTSNERASRLPPSTPAASAFASGSPGSLLSGWANGSVDPHGHAADGARSCPSVAGGASPALPSDGRLTTAVPWVTEGRYMRPLWTSREPR
jgi:hypothetical protein